MSPQRFSTNSSQPTFESWKPTEANRFVEYLSMRVPTHFIAPQSVIAKLVSRHMEDLEEMRRRDSAPVGICTDGTWVG